MGSTRICPTNNVGWCFFCVNSRVLQMGFLVSPLFLPSLILLFVISYPLLWETARPDIRTVLCTVCCTCGWYGLVCKEVFSSVDAIDLGVSFFV